MANNNLYYLLSIIVLFASLYAYFRYTNNNEYDQTLSNMKINSEIQKNYNNISDEAVKEELSETINKNNTLYDTFDENNKTLNNETSKIENPINNDRIVSLSNYFDELHKSD